MSMYYWAVSVIGGMQIGTASYELSRHALIWGSIDMALGWFAVGVTSVLTARSERRRRKDNANRVLHSAGQLQGLGQLMDQVVECKCCCRDSG